MAKLSPSRSSTVVEVSRRVKASTRAPLISTLLLGSIEETAAFISRLMMSLSTTRGTKFSWMPKGLYSIENRSSFWAIGIGYSPPARNLASWPESAVRFGSARVRTMPFCSSASSSSPTCTDPALKPKSTAPVLSLARGRRPAFARLRAGWFE